MTTGTGTAIRSEGIGALADGSPVRRWTLERDGVRVRVLTYGAIVRSVEVPGRDGSPAPVALGLPEVAGYEEFPSTVLRPGEEFVSRTEYALSVR